MKSKWKIHGMYDTQYGLNVPAKNAGTGPFYAIVNANVMGLLDKNTKTM